MVILRLEHFRSIIIGPVDRQSTKAASAFNTAWARNGGAGYSGLAHPA